MLLLVASLGLLGSVGCAAKPPVLRLADIEISRVDFQKLDTVFVLDVINVNSGTIKLERVDYELVSGGQSFASGEVADPLTLAGQQSAHVRVPASVEYRKLYKAVRDSARAHEPLGYELRCNARFDLGGVKSTTAMTHRGKIARAPRWKYKGVVVDRDKLAVVVTFELNNPNEFAFPVVGVRGALNVGDDPVISFDQANDTVVPANGTADLRLRIAAGKAGLAKLAAAVARREMPDFDGELKFSAPTSLKRLMLGLPTTQPLEKPAP